MSNANRKKHPIKKPACAGFFIGCPAGSADVLADQRSQLEHRNLVFTEDFFQLGIGIDVAPVCGILQVMLLDVDPQLADDLGAG